MLTSKLPTRITVPAPDDPVAALAAVVALRRLAGTLEVRAVRVAVQRGWTWAQVGEALGVSAQAAHRKHATRLRRAARHDEEVDG
ncbi:helix-turn-helix domain-containing protein [Euzebya sp.]|uniref:helix-turn-helix domain-containing protein n=1 Tax=Euzebya sp. TaxID=1971409 RepID=UPI003514FF23